MSIFTTLRDAVLGTTPQRVVQRSLDKIDATIEVESEKIRKQLAPFAIPPPFVNDTTGNPAFEAVRCIDAQAAHRVSAIISVDDRHEGAAKGAGSQAGDAEFEARCRIKEVEW